MLANRLNTLANRLRTLANWTLAKRLVSETTDIPFTLANNPLGLKSTMSYFCVLHFTLCYMYFACSKLQTSRLVVIITITSVRFHCMAFPIDNSLLFFYGSENMFP